MELKRLSARTEDSTMNLRKGSSPPGWSSRLRCGPTSSRPRGVRRDGGPGEEEPGPPGCGHQDRGGIHEHGGGTPFIGVRDKKRSTGTSPPRFSDRARLSVAQEGQARQRGLRDRSQVGNEESYSNKAAEQLYVDISFPRSDGKEFGGGREALPRVRGNQLYTKTETDGG